MGPAAVSFEVVSSRQQDIADEVRQAVAQIGGSAAGGLLFLCGAMARQPLEVGHLLQSTLGAPALVVSGTGVLSERGERENTSAAVGLVWRTGSGVAFALEGEDPQDPLRVRTFSAAKAALGDRSGGIALFASRDTVDPLVLFEPSEQPSGLAMFGGGGIGQQGVVAVTPQKVQVADVAGLAIRGFSPPVVHASSACRPLGEFRPITEVDGSLITGIGGRSALEVLKEQGGALQARRVILLAVEVGDEEAWRPRVMVRGIRGIHEPRGGVIIAGQVPKGSRVAYAALEPQSAREDLDTTLRAAARSAAGGVPLFAVYVNCAGRGTSLYGDTDVDVQAIRSRWPKLPFAGVMSAYEIGPVRGGTGVHLYSGVFALFCAAS